MNFLDERRLQVKVARLYYEHNLTQSQIGTRLRLSRQKVQRLLQQARDAGIVQIWIQPISGVYTDMEEALERRFGLQDVRIVETCAYEDQEIISRELGAAAADYLLHIIRPRDKIVISNWSRAIQGMVNALRFSRKRVAGVVVIQGLSELVYPPLGTFDPGDLTRDLAKALGGRALLIPAPGIATDSVSRAAFCQDPLVAHVLEQARAADMAFMGVGAVGPEPTPMWEGDIVSTVELSDLVERGAVGEINLHYFDAQGQPVSSSLDDRVLGLTLEEIRAIGRTVCVAGGSEKFAAILGVLNGHIADVLIADHVTAQHLLKAV